MKLIFITAPRPQVQDVDVFDVPSKPAEIRWTPGGMIYLFPLGENFWTLPLYHN
jgi:hypothetical protein